MAERRKISLIFCKIEVCPRYAAIFYMPEVQAWKRGLPESLKEESGQNTVHNVSLGIACRLPGLHLLKGETNLLLLYKTFSPPNHGADQAQAGKQHGIGFRFRNGSNLHA